MILFVMRSSPSTTLRKVLYYLILHEVWVSSQHVFMPVIMLLVFNFYVSYQHYTSYTKATSHLPSPCTLTKLPATLWCIPIDVVFRTFSSGVKWNKLVQKYIFYTRRKKEKTEKWKAIAGEEEMRLLLTYWATVREGSKEPEEITKD